MTDRVMRFCLLGTGSSGGVPRVGNDWGRCNPNDPRNRRRRCSALLDVFEPGRDAQTRVLIDTSPDLREQLLDAHVGHLDAIVFTHDHADQTHGIDDVRALALRQRKQIKTYLDDATAASLIQKFRYCFEGHGGYPPILDRQAPIEAYKPFQVSGQGGPVTLMPLDQEHGRIRSLGFRIGGLAYCNDVSDMPQQSFAELQELDVLILDALRYSPHPTHAHLELALEWIEQLQPKRAVLTNLHVDLDYETLISELPRHVEPAFDGMVIELPLAAADLRL
ncbi:MAG: MBL fold metallo-hydrolase [Pseudomonadota bacterium]